MARLLVSLNLAFMINSSVPDGISRMYLFTQTRLLVWLICLISIVIVFFSSIVSCRSIVGWRF